MVKTLQISATEKLKISEEKIQIVQQINVGLEVTFQKKNKMIFFKKF